NLLYYASIFILCFSDTRNLLSFPTRRSSDLRYDEGFLDVLRGFRFRGNVDAMREGEIVFPEEPLLKIEGTVLEAALVEAAVLNIDRKSTRLNSSHVKISYAVFCLKKKISTVL